jgi:hypothetical protein
MGWDTNLLEYPNPSVLVKFQIGMGVLVWGCVGMAQTKTRECDDNNVK